VQKFAYKVEFIGAGGGPEALERALNGAAGLGWRCVHYQHNPNSTWTLVFEMENPVPATAFAEKGSA
jgi:hypothetical protein